MYDVAVIGGGVIGGMVLRQLTRYNLKVCLIEKENDVCMGQSKANSGIVHAGFDAKEGTLKAKFNVLGTKMLPQVAKELGVKYKNDGSLVVAFTPEDEGTLKSLYERGVKNGVSGLEIIEKEQLKQLEPNISDEAIAALYAKTGGIICPYELTIAAIGNAMDNGAKLYLNFNTVKIEGDFGGYTLTAEDERRVSAAAIVNCAAAGSDKIASLIGDASFKIGFRKGEYILFDRQCKGYINHTLFFTPTKKGKGILMTPTVDGNILLGPTAEVQDCPETSTSAEGLAAIKEKAAKMCKNVPFYNAITSFAGVRAFCDRHDFIIEESQVKKGFINCVGIESPGLTSAPAIAEYAVNELIGGLFDLKENESFNPYREPDYFFNNLSVSEKNEIIKKDPSYGHIICRCEGITEGEIKRALTENPRATDIDGVKRRTRAGMGRCQGGFCQPYVAEMLADKLNIPLEKVTKCGAGSEILTGKTK